MIYDAVIIGSGVGGLFSALSLVLSGKKVILIEKQPVPGGLATSFSRKGFKFESSIHCVGALGKDGEIRKFLDEAGISQNLSFIDLVDFARIIYPEHNFVVDFNRNNLIDYLQTSFPQEKHNIKKLFSRIDKFYHQFDWFTGLKLPFILKLILSPIIFPQIIPTSLKTIDQYLSVSIKDNKLKSILTDIWGFVGLPPDKVSAFYFLVVLRDYYFNNTSYVKGGFQSLFNEIVKKIKAGGSEVKFDTAVAKILTKDNKVTGVLTDKNEEILSSAVISNVNAIETLTTLLDKEEIVNYYKEKLANMERSISAVQLYLALDSPAKDLGMTNAIISLNALYDHAVAFESCLSEDFERCQFFLTDHAQIDPSLVPQGKGSLIVIAFSDFDKWKDLTVEDYKIKKEVIAKKMIQRIETVLKDLSKHIEFMEVATPLTIERYGNAPRGALYGFSQTINQSGINRLSQDTKIKGLFLTGAWTQPGGGVHACFVSARDAASMTLKFLKA